MRGPGAPASLLFKLIVPATAVFIVTVMSLIAVVFSDPRAPVAKFLNAYGTSLLVVEFLAVIGLSLLAMTVDRIRTLRELHKSSKENTEAQIGQLKDRQREPRCCQIGNSIAKTTGNLFRFLA